MHPDYIGRNNSLFTSASSTPITLEPDDSLRENALGQHANSLKRPPTERWRGVVKPSAETSTGSHNNTIEKVIPCAKAELDAREKQGQERKKKFFENWGKRFAQLEELEEPCSTSAYRTVRDVPVSFTDLRSANEPAESKIPLTFLGSIQRGDRNPYMVEKTESGFDQKTPTLASKSLISNSSQQSNVRPIHTRAASLPPSTPSSLKDSGVVQRKSPV